jgi:hypothetical protein
VCTAAVVRAYLMFVCGVDVVSVCCTCEGVQQSLFIVHALQPCVSKSLLATSSLGAGWQPSVVSKEAFNCGGMCRRTS